MPDAVKKIDGQSNDGPDQNPVIPTDPGIEISNVAPTTNNNFT